MSRSFTRASSHYTHANISGPPWMLDATPYTVACWASSASTTVEQYAFGPCVASGISVAFLGWRGDLANDPILFYCWNNAPASAPSSSPSGYTADTWYHACGVTTTTTSRKVYLNGAASAENTVSVGAPSAQQMTQGCFAYSGIRSEYFDGKIMHCAAWNVALNDDEINSLYKGFSPSRIRPQNLKYYDPCIRTFQSLRSGVSSYTDNSGGPADHHRAYGY